MADPRSYDSVQREAVLVRCAGCGRSFFMTVPRERCVDCQDPYLNLRKP